MDTAVPGQANPPLVVVVRKLKGTPVRFLLKWDDRRVRDHLARVEARLREVDTSTWSVTRRDARENNLDRLHAYWQCSKFPRNHDYIPYKWRVPCFIDTEERACAVAQLMIDSGETVLTQHIAASANYAALKAMRFPELEVWAARSGLSIEELALIQPSYPAKFIKPLLGLGIVVSIAIIYLNLAFQANAADINHAMAAGMLLLIGLSGLQGITGILVMSSFTIPVSATIVVLTRLISPTGDQSFTLTVSGLITLGGSGIWLTGLLWFISSEVKGKRRRHRIQDLTSVEDLPQLFDLLGGVDSGSAAEAIRKIGTPAIPGLLSMLNPQANLLVRKRVIEVLAEIADPSATPGLLAALKWEKNDHFKASLTDILKRLGSDAIQ